MTHLPSLIRRTFCTIRRFIASKHDVNQVPSRGESVELATPRLRRPSAENRPPPVIVVARIARLGELEPFGEDAPRQHLPQRKVYVLDARNHGDSPHSQSHRYEDLAADIRAFCRRFRIERASLVGHSMGGLAVMYFTLTNPDFVEKLITVDVSPVSTNPIIATMPIILKQLSDVQFLKQGNLISAKKDVDRQLAMTMTDPGLRLYILMNVVQDENGQFVQVAHQFVVVDQKYSNMMKFPDVSGKVYNGPALFVGGEKSACLRKRDHVDIQKLFPQAEFKTIAGAGHWCHTDKPEVFIKHATEFLNANKQATSIKRIKCTLIESF